MKKLILITCLILVFTFFNYPVFDSLGISYLIIFSCFVIICFAGAKIYTSDAKEDYASVEAEMDELIKFDGIFQYEKDGFYINREDSIEFVKWEDIIMVNSFRIPVIYRKEARGLEIITDTKNYEFNYRYTPGIEKLVNKLQDNLQTWEVDLIKVKVNNHGLEKTNLYKRNNISN